MSERVTTVAGREIRWRTAGSGAPAVVLEAGLTGSASQWSAVLPRLAETTRVVAVSRAGYGGSTPVGRRPARRSVDDLAAVLEQVSGPLVLVGHSWGGLLCRLYAARHPERVSALVLVDATHEGIAMMRTRRWAVLAGLGMRVTARRARTGRLRAELEAGTGAYASVLAGLPAEARPALVDEITSQAPWSQGRRDVRAVQQTLRELHRSPLPLPAVPVVALVGGRPDGRQGRSRAVIRAAYEQWLPTLPDGRLVIAPSSGHLVPHEDEDLLVELVREVVAEVGSSQRTMGLPAV